MKRLSHGQLLAVAGGCAVAVLILHFAVAADAAAVAAARVHVPVAAGTARDPVALAAVAE